METMRADAALTETNALLRQLIDRLSPPPPEPRPVVPTPLWREAGYVVERMQEFRDRIDPALATTDIAIPTDGRPVGIIFVGDAHLGSWSTDHAVVERVVDEILNTPGLHVGLVGDMAQMAIRLRSVDEVADNALPADIQLHALASLVEEIAPKLVLSTWDNHAVVREEQLAGRSVYADIMKTACPYFDGIGHPDLIVGDQRYKLAVSHKFRGRSTMNPCAGPMRYLKEEGFEREIAVAGDSHRPGIMSFWHGPTKKLAVNSGTAQVYSRYAQRYYSLYSHAIFPVVEFDPEEHRFVAYDDVPTWVRSTGRG